MPPASPQVTDRFRAAGEYHQILAHLGLSARNIFTDPRIKVWRSIPERENCTFDGTRPDGSPIRLHIKRFKRTTRRNDPASAEVLGIRVLQVARIPTVPLVGWGKLRNGRSFLITEDLAGYQPADKLIESGTPFELLLDPTCALTADLHNAGLRHRDLYLCHFFVKIERGKIDLRLIDAARVSRLPFWPARNRWIVKDLAQFHFSANRLNVKEDQLAGWLARYGELRALKSVDMIRRAIDRKVRWIADHDAKLNEKQPHRNISLPHN